MKELSAGRTARILLYLLLGQCVAFSPLTFREQPELRSFDPSDLIGSLLQGASELACNKRNSKSDCNSRSIVADATQALAHTWHSVGLVFGVNDKDEFLKAQLALGFCKWIKEEKTCTWKRKTGAKWQFKEAMRYAYPEERWTSGAMKERVEEMGWSEDPASWFTPGTRGCAPVPWCMTVPGAQTIASSSNAPGADAGVAIGWGLLQNPDVTALDLSQIRITNVGATAIAAALKVNTKLKYLSIDGIPIDNVGVTAIAAALKVNRNLQYLSIGQIPIGDAGAKAIANALKANTVLKEVYLFQNQIGDQGAEAISKALVVNRALTKLVLSHNRITFAGFQPLASALLTVENVTPRASLKTLLINGNPLTDLGAFQLQEWFNAVGLSAPSPGQPGTLWMTWCAQRSGWVDACAKVCEPSCKCDNEVWLLGKGKYGENCE